MARDDRQFEEPGDELRDDEYPDDGDDDDVDSDTAACPHCGAEVYEDAVRCPECGEYMVEESGEAGDQLLWGILVGIVVIVVAFVAVGWLLTR
jgi:predicted nucleic acid-binding Zn ribbon protein